MIKLVRADDRLIHGMVAVSWTSSVGPETILVANDEAANDDFKKTSLNLAKPAGVKMFIKTKEAAIKALNNPINDRKKIFLVTQTVEDAYEVYQGLNTKFKNLNIGTAGVNRKPGETYVSTLPNIYVTPTDYECAKKMVADGVTVFAQGTPTHDRMEFSEIKKIMEK